MLVKVEEACVFLCLGDAACLYRYFYVDKWNRMVFCCKNRKSVAELVLAKILRFLAGNKCCFCYKGCNNGKNF